MKHHVIGIDLGTTYSAVAAYDNDQDRAELLGNPESAGEETTPSVVGLHPATGKIIVGRAAKRNLPADPLNTIIELKREMGEVFDADKHRGVDGFTPGEPFRVRFQRYSDQWFLPQEISAFILMKMKDVAEYDIGEELRDAVVTVPAYFHATQKKATEQAALMAGLYPRQLIAEPTAAAICFGVDEYDPERNLYLVYDLGGGTFDVSIIDVQKEDIKVVATAGDARLGGSDLDERITGWAVGQLKQLGLDVGGDERARAAIRYEAEQAKIRLSTFESTNMDLALLRPADPPQVELTRAKFEELIERELSKSMNGVEEALRFAEEKGYKRDALSAILLVGGSTGIPAVRTMLMDYFGKGEEFVRGDLDPASVVARGAATLARRFSPTRHPFDVQRRPDASIVATDEEGLEGLGFKDPVLITEHSLGVGVQEGQVVRLVDRGTILPTTVRRGGFGNPGPLEYFRAPVYQGEGEDVHECTLIGEVPMGPMEPRERGFHSFEVLFTLDKNGLLSVVVKHLNTGAEYRAEFEHGTSISGDEALKAIRSKLLDMYQPMVMTDGAVVEPARPAAGPGDYVPPAPPTETPGAPGAQTPVAPAPPVAEPPPSVPAQAVQPSATDTTAAGQPAAPFARETTTKAPGGAAVPPTTPEEPVAGGAKAVPRGPVAPAPVQPPAREAPRSEGPREPAVPVPEQFKGIVRRARKQLLRHPDEELLDAWEDFVGALNRGAGDDVVVGLGDDLEDAYFDARSRTRG